MDDAFGEINPRQVCEICDGTDFYLDLGFYVCSTCGTQSQHQEYVAEERFDTAAMGPSHAFILRETKAKKDAAEPDKRVMLSSWEIYNVVVKMMADKLVEIGFPPLLREKVFQLWVRFLVKRQVIFVCTRKEKPSRVSFSDPILNLRAIYGHEFHLNHVNKRKKEIRDAEKQRLKLLQQESETGGASKRRKTMQKRKAFKEDYLASQVSQVIQEQKDEENEILDIFASQSQPVKSDENMEIDGQIVSVNDRQQTGNNDVQKQLSKIEDDQRDRPIRLTDQAAFVKQILEEIEPDSSLKFRCVDADGYKLPKSSIFRRAVYLTEPLRFSIRTIFALLFISLRQIGCNVLISDFISLFYDGTIFVESAYPLLNDEMRFTSRNNADNLFSFLNLTFTIKGIADKVTNLNLVINVPYRFPSLGEILPKYIDDFCLPKEFEHLVLHIHSMFSMNENFNDLQRSMLEHLKPLGELWTVAHILIILKMLFGLDDTTEKFNAHFAQKFNKIMNNLKNNSHQYFNQQESEFFTGQETEWTELFDIEMWYSYIRHRYNFLQHELFNPSMYNPNIRPNATNVQDLIKRFGGKREKVCKDGPYNPRVNKASKSAVSFLNELVEQKTRTKPIPELPVYITANLPNEDIVDKYLKSTPQVAYPNSSINIEKYRHNFGNQRIDFIFNPHKYSPLFQKFGYRVKVIEGDAVNRDYGQKIYLKKGQLVIFQPYKKYDDFIAPYDSKRANSDALNFLLLLGVKLVSGTERDDYGLKLLINILNTFGDLYCKRCRGQTVPMANYWS